MIRFDDDCERRRPMILIYRPAEVEEENFYQCLVFGKAASCMLHRDLQIQKYK